MATSLVHIGDFHAAPGPRNEARYRALDQLIAEASQLPSLGAWLWPGDLNHRIGVRLEIEDQNALIERLRRMSAVAPVVIVYGNHDVAGDLDKFVEAANGNPIYVVDRPQVLRIRLATMDFASIACLPYPHKHGLVMAGCANPDIVDAAAEHLDAIFMQLAAELEQARERSDLTLFIGHVNVGGSIVSSGQPNIGKEIELSPRHLDRLGPIYKGLNHIHKAQEIHGAHYPGSICRLDWGEIEQKRWLEVRCVVDVDSLAIRDDRELVQWISEVKPHAIDVAPMYYTEGELTRDGYTYEVIAGPGGEKQDPPLCSCVLPIEGSWTDVGVDRIVPYRFGESISALKACTQCRGYGVSWQGCEVRARYRVKASERGVVDKSLVARAYEGAALFHPDPITVPDRQLRAPEVAAAKTLSDKIAAWCALGGFVAGEGVIEKLADLETHDRQDVIEGAGLRAVVIQDGEVDDPNDAQKATVAA